MKFVCNVAPAGPCGSVFTCCASDFCRRYRATAAQLLANNNFLYVTLIMSHPPVGESSSLNQDTHVSQMSETFFTEHTHIIVTPATCTRRRHAAPPLGTAISTRLSLLRTCQLEERWACGGVDGPALTSTSSLQPIIIGASNATTNAAGHDASSKTVAAPTRAKFTT